MIYLKVILTISSVITSVLIFQRLRKRYYEIVHFLNNIQLVCSHNRDSDDCPVCITTYGKTERILISLIRKDIQRFINQS